jgi:hypothetical protein
MQKQASVILLLLLFFFFCFFFFGEFSLSFSNYQGIWRSQIGLHLDFV